MSNTIEDINNPMENVQSHDWNKERLETLKKLYPDLFANEGKVNIREIAKLMDYASVNETERYEFRWFGKSNAKREAFTPTDATLVYDEGRSVNPTESENIIIEGENLAVLKLLSNSYREQVKCIYIDPPYNTGNDFVYSDKFNQDKKEYWEDAEITENGFKIDSNAETDGRFHSNWLNMMYSRLLIARQLLKEDGVIFISIDDNEVHHLRKLCDDVFGEENFLGLFVVNSSPSGIDYGHMAKTNDYALFYAKNIDFTETFFIKEKNKKFTYSDDLGGYNIAPLYNGNVAFNPTTRPNLYYPFYLNPNNLIENIFYEIDTKPHKGWVEVFPVISKKDGIQRVWRWGKPKSSSISNLNKEIVGYKNTAGEYRIVQKNRHSSKMIRSLLLENIYSSRRGTAEIEDYFKKKIFSYPKPSDLIKTFAEISLDKNDVILDFFAGSGPTGQAITRLNQEDRAKGQAGGGNRKYILVQLPEQTDEKSEAYKAGYKKISDITIERNKRVVEKIQKELKEKEEKKKGELSFDIAAESSVEYGKKKKSGLGFKVFKLQKSNFPRVEFAPDPEKTEEENIELLKKYIKDKEAQLVSAFNKEELITEILIKNGFKLNYTLTKQEEFKKNEILFATDGDKETLICLDVIIADETVAHFKTNTEQKLIVLERALDTTKKWNLKHAMGDKFNAF